MNFKEYTSGRLRGLTLQTDLGLNIQTADYLMIFHLVNVLLLILKIDLLT